MKMKKVLACLLAATAAISMFGCKEKGGDNSTSSSGAGDSTALGAIPEASNPQTDFQAHYVEGMLHEVSVDYNSPANLTFIKNGQSEYKIVKGSKVANESAAYVNKHFGFATGCMLEEEKLENVELSENSTYILFGCEELLEEAGFIMPTFEKLGSPRVEIRLHFLLGEY